MKTAFAAFTAELVKLWLFESYKNSPMMILLPARLQIIEPLSFQFFECAALKLKADLAGNVRCGHLIFFLDARFTELVPDSKTLPGFGGRWDDKDQSIDVDPEPGDCIDRDTWRGEIRGYRGHHAATLSADPRVYYIDIATPHGPVFRARVRLNTEIGVRVGDSLYADIACDAVVVSKSAQGLPDAVQRRGPLSSLVASIVQFLRNLFRRTSRRRMNTRPPCAWSCGSCRKAHNRARRAWNSDRHFAQELKARFSAADPRQIPGANAR